jgi:hypothetical protein
MVAAVKGRHYFARMKLALTNRQRTAALGRWGELKSLVLLERAGFTTLRDLNHPAPHHPFADVLAHKDGDPYIIGVKTRCKFKENGRINDSYNMVKTGADVSAIAASYNAQPAWVTIQVIPELQTFSAFFGKFSTERLSVPMRGRDTDKYKREGDCLADNEIDPTILPEWTNGGYALSGLRAGSD